MDLFGLKTLGLILDFFGLLLIVLKQAEKISDDKLGIILCMIGTILFFI